MIRYIQLSIIYLLSLGFNLKLNAQTTSQLKTNVELNNKLYKADFSFYVEKRDTVKHGAFKMEMPIVDDENENRKHYLTFSGFFDRNRPTGKWVYRKGEFKPFQQAIFTNYQYVFEVDGTELYVSGDFDNGIKNSAWEIFQKEIVRSEITDTTLAASLPFVKDKLKGKVTYKLNGRSFQGVIGENELAEGKWQFFEIESPGNQKKMVKEWRFSENILTDKVLFLENDETIRLDLNSYFESDSVKEEIVMDKNYYEIIDLITYLNNKQDFNSYKSSSWGSSYLAEMKSMYQEVDDFVYPVIGKHVSADFKAVIYKSPYTDMESEILDNIDERISETDSIIDKIQKDPQVNLARISTSQVAWYASALDIIRTEILDAIDSTMILYHNGNMQYVNRNKLIANNIRMPDSIGILSVYQGDSTLKEYRFKDVNLNDKNTPLKNLDSYSDAIRMEVMKIRDSIDFYLFEIKKEEKLVAIEAELIKKYEENKDLISNLISEPQNELARMNLNALLMEFMDKVLLDYSSIPTTEEKMTSVEEVYACLSKVEGLVRLLENTPEKRFIIRDAYTKQVFNPYTFTNMEETLKAPIYKAFNDTLLPALFENLTKLDCVRIDDFAQNFENVYEGMIDILKRGDTRRDERRVRKTKDPQRIADILDLKLTF